MAGDTADYRAAENYAARTSPNPAYASVWTFHERFLPEREAILRDVFRVSDIAPDSVVSSYHERLVWRVSQFGPDEESRTTHFVASDYNDEEDRFPTIEYFLQSELHPRVGNFYLKVEYVGNDKGDIDVTPPDADEKEQYAVLQRVFAALTRLFIVAQERDDPTPPRSVLATLRNIDIDMQVNERFGEKILLDMVHMLSELEIAFEAFAASVVMPQREARVSRHFGTFPLSLSYRMVTTPKFHRQQTGKRDPPILPFVINHLRIGGEQQQQTWAAASWDPLNATDYFRPEKRLALDTIYTRRVRGRQTMGQLGMAGDADFPVIVAQAPSY